MELKFRLWDSDTQEMNPVVYLKLEGLKEFNEQCGYILMQYTGLKDSNGKDVYEGDIVLVTPHAGMDKSSYYGVFEFVPGGFQLKAPKERFHFGGGYVPYSQSLGLLCGIEIVGNIYENKDLLKEIE